MEQDLYRTDVLLISQPIVLPISKPTVLFINQPIVLIISQPIPSKVHINTRRQLQKLIKTEIGIFYKSLTTNTMKTENC